MSVNVNRSVSDQFYRYKMPRLIAKVGMVKALGGRPISGMFSWVRPWLTLVSTDLTLATNDIRIGTIIEPQGNVDSHYFSPFSANCKYGLKVDLVCGKWHQKSPTILLMLHFFIMSFKKH